MCVCMCICSVFGAHVCWYACHLRSLIYASLPDEFKRMAYTKCHRSHSNILFHSAHFAAISRGGRDGILLSFISPSNTCRVPIGIYTYIWRLMFGISEMNSGSCVCFCLGMLKCQIRIKWDILFESNVISDNIRRGRNEYEKEQQMKMMTMMKKTNRSINCVRHMCFGCCVRWK